MLMDLRAPRSGTVPASPVHPYQLIDFPAVADGSPSQRTRTRDGANYCQWKSSCDDASWELLGTCAFSPPSWCLPAWAHHFLYSEAKGYGGHCACQPCLVLLR
ncbi:hypothetical protein SEVIR_8G249790v4 [Setaria viridis]|uniref:Uncharacterized protein n=1 Tax=Setaria viridis TaxID=4556 RepID=A0A4U6TNI3_SETVI|nr:hypothetical protein SEVIR_8G249790v2 [Setaria viridis]